MVNYEEFKIKHTRYKRGQDKDDKTTKHRFVILNEEKNLKNITR